MADIAARIPRTARRRSGESTVQPVAPRCRVRPDRPISSRPPSRSGERTSGELMSDDRRGSDGAPRKLRFAIIGAGLAGILSAIKLTEAGDTDFTIYEKADRLGGTWRENTYPGIACDVPSHLYSYSFAPNPEWSHVFSAGDEIWAYLDDVARRHHVGARIRYGTEVTRMA